MTGSVAAISGGFQNIVYGTGLYGPSGVDLTPITSSASGVISFTRTWIGYIKPSIDSPSVGLSSTRTAGSGTVVGYVWIGPTAISGYNTGNASITANNTSSTVATTLIANQYYPIRIQWTVNITTSLSSAALSFSINGTTDVTGEIFYNTLSNGF
jgi:hypothetical protein